jgi:hypothetical protein
MGGEIRKSLHDDGSHPSRIPRDVELQLVRIANMRPSPSAEIYNVPSAPAVIPANGPIGPDMLPIAVERPAVCVLCSKETAHKF